MTALAAYLTTVSNDPSLRQTRAWKRFVHVRTDDLQSVRAERAIKRVRSDLAAHIRSKADVSVQLSSTNVSSSNHSEMVDGVESINDTVEGEVVLNDPTISALREEDIKEEEEDLEANAPSSQSMAAQVRPIEIEKSDNGTPNVPPADNARVTHIDTDTVTNGAVGEEETTLPTPVADIPASRIPRSHSADPDKASRLSRVYTSTLQDGTSSATGDESSISTTARRARKKRSQSTDPSRKKKAQRKVAIDDFEMMRVLGKGCAGKVLLVRHKMSSDLYALKAITKRHVLAHQELQHTLTEQAVLKRMAKESKDPFVVKLWWSFHDKENLFLVMDFHPGGDLATQLARWGRLGRDRARFYAAEIVEGVEGLHVAGVIYRDLKPENILIGADGHIVLTDFGLSKEFPRRSEPASPPWMKGEKGQDLSVGWPGQGVVPADTTTTFCGTAEYLAPEVIQGLSYSYEVDWWSFGTMLYEMLTGITPFWANNHSDMYVRVLQDELQFPEDRAMDQDTKSLIRGLLQRNPALRICEPRIKRHPYFSMIDWSHVYYKRYIPPYIPPIDPSNASDTQNFDDTIAIILTAKPADGEDAYPTPSHSRSPSVRPDESNMDVFDGYSFKGRYSVIIDDEDEDGTGDSGEEETDEEDIPSVLTDMLDSPAQPPEAEVVTESPVSDEQLVEPKTPEARPQALLEEVPELEKATGIVELSPSVDLSSTPRTTEPPAHNVPAAEPVEPAPPLPAKDSKPKATKVPASSKSTVRNTRNRREKSGIPALDRFLSDGPDEDGEMTEREDDDDWDFIEADGEDRNGTKGTSLFARGVVDRYRLAVFRKASTPSQRVAGRSASGFSKELDLHAVEPADSPSPSEKRRGRTPGLKFRKTPQFLKGKSPPSSFSAKSASTIKTSTPSNAATSTTISSISSNGLLTPSVSAASTMAMSPSLRSKESAISVGNQSQSSDQSNGETAEPVSLPASPEVSKYASHHSEEPEKLKSKKLKKYKENAEKVLSLFASQR
ncbi:kinase-like domain-containing protein [Butyriboletus roseoflavus]|nr:kinase-like domain-containing protein [Butyriboletus roseoflavus]